jgi:hypothetical protein
MNHSKTKVYSDGSHYIGIPHTERYRKKRKKIIARTDKAKEQKVKEIYRNSEERTRKERTEKTIEEVNKEIKDYEKSKELVNKVLEKENRNRIVRLTRLYRKANLQQWNYFCTFTYDDNKLSEDEFKTKFLNCLRHLTNRKDWRYIGVFERSPTNNRLHFHGIFKTPQMVGEFVETKDYSTKTHQMQVANQNTFFLERFGRNDFKSIENNVGTSDAIKYMLKYIHKTGEKVIYSKHLQTYYITDILEEDVVCRIGQEDRKLLLFDDFKCMDLETGEYFGNVSPEVIDKMPKSN